MSNKKDIEILSDENVSIDMDGFPYFRFKIKVIPFEVIVSGIAYHHTGWDFYLEQ